MTERRKLVVVGNGMAGARFVEELVARGGRDAWDIVMFGDEPYGNYNRILLSGVLAGTHDPRDTFLNPLKWYEDNAVTLHAGVKVRGIDRRARVVHAGNGVMERYDELVLATGSVPFVPPLERLRLDDGSFREGAFVFRTLDDTEAMINYAKHSKKAAVLGGGLLGLEAARGLLALGLEVHVVHLMKHLMEVQLDPAAGRMLHGLLKNMGMHVHLGRATCGVIGEERVQGLLFADGLTLDCDMLVISAGIRPSSQLAVDAGLEVERGVVVGDDLRTSDPHVHAIGECAQHRGATYGLVAPLWEQARVLADRLSGRKADAAYLGSRVSTKLKVAGVELAVMGVREATSPDDEEVTYSEPARGVYKKLVVRDGKLAGAILLGDASSAPALLQAFDRDQRALREPRGAALPAGLRRRRAERRRPPGRRADLQLQRRLQGHHRRGHQEGLPVPRGALQHHARGHRVRHVQAGRRRPARGRRRRRSGRGPQRALLRARRAAGQARARARHPGARPPQRLGRLPRARGGQGGRGEQAGPRVAAQDALGRRVRRRARRALHQRPRARQHPEGWHLQRHPAHLRRRHERRPAPHASPTWPSAIRPRWSRSPAASASICSASRRIASPQVWRELGMPSGHAYAKSFRTCKTCVGTDFCRYGVGDSTALGIAIERRFQGLESPAKLKLATAGCPRNCSEAMVKDVGAVAIEGGRWEIYVGGGAGSHIRKGDILCVVDSHDEVLRMMGRFMQYYREQARYLERTYRFVERVGIEKLRRLLVDDEEGIAARLDESMQASVDAYVDPWLEADAPKTPGQFADALAPTRADETGEVPVVHLRLASGER